MEPKDYWPIIISIIAAIISLITFLHSFLQKQKENKRIIRKDLTDCLEKISDINLETASLSKETADDNINEITGLRRMYNTLRRTLVAHASFIMKNYPDIIDDSDCLVMAMANSAIGNFPQAKVYWGKSVELSENEIIKHMNLRGYGRFLFTQGDIEVGRSKYEEALKLSLSNTDEMRRMIADTYLLWAYTEKAHGFNSEAIRLVEKAQTSCDHIGNKIVKASFQKRIDTFRL